MFIDLKQKTWFTVFLQLLQRNYSVSTHFRCNLESKYSKKPWSYRVKILVVCISIWHKFSLTICFIYYLLARQFWSFYLTLWNEQKHAWKHTTGMRRDPRWSWNSYSKWLAFNLQTFPIIKCMGFLPDRHRTKKQVWCRNWRKEWGNAVKQWWQAVSTQT